MESCLGSLRRGNKAPLVVWPLEGHAMTIAPPRTGKGNLLACGEHAGARRAGLAGLDGVRSILGGSSTAIVARRRRHARPQGCAARPL